MNSNLTIEKKADIVLEKMIEGLVKEGIKIKGQHMPLLYRFKSLVVRVVSDVDRAVLTSQQGIAMVAEASGKVLEMISDEHDTATA